MRSPDRRTRRIGLYAIEKGLSENIRREAKERGVSPHPLVNLWLQEKIQELKPQSRRG
jgi:hypothetical protein